MTGTDWSSSIIESNGSITLVHGDCLIEMEHIPDGSVDRITADLPYGTTRNRWDSKLPLDELWRHYWRILKPTGVVALTARRRGGKAAGRSTVDARPGSQRDQRLSKEEKGPGDCLPRLSATVPAL